MKAQEANIGRPHRYARAAILWNRPSRTIATSLYYRDFERARVILRMQQGWVPQTYTDERQSPITLPSGERWIPLHTDGTVGSTYTSIILRNSEAAIMLRGSKM